MSIADLTEHSTAIHESAHFYAGWKFKHDVESLTIVPSSDGALGVYSKRPGPDMELDDETDASRVRNENNIIELLAGPAAEYYFLGKPVWETLPGDLTPAVRYACLRHFDGTEADVVAYVRYLWVVTQSFVSDSLNWHSITSLAGDLLALKTISAEGAVARLEAAAQRFKAEHPSRQQPVCRIMESNAFDPVVARVLRELGAIP